MTFLNLFPQNEKYHRFLTLNQTAASSIDFHVIFFHTMEVNGYQQLSG